MTSHAYERRANWKEGLGKKAKMKAEKRQALLIQLDATREAIRQTGMDFARYDALKAEQRRVIAELSRQ